MPRYDSLRTLAFQLKKSTTELTHRFYTLDFPRQWEVEFKQLQGEFNKWPSYKRTLPIKNLNQAVRALVPDLISISRYTDIDRTYRKSNSTYRWLFSTMPVNVDALHLIIYNWVDIAFAKASSESRQRILGNLKSEALSWNEERVNLADWNTHQNGTAKANNTDIFNILPDWIAAKLSQPGIFLEYGPERLRFRRVPISAGGRGAEIISWPPIQVEDNEQRRWFYSVVITFSVQTIPFQAHPLIYCDLGIRRWISQPDTHLGGGQTSVYLLTQVPWVQGLHQSNSFQVASVRWKKLKQPVESGVNFRLEWSGQLTQLLNNLNPHQPFPNPEQIRQDPLTSLNLDSSPNSAIVYSTGMIPSHNVGTGFMPVDRRSFAEQIADLLQPDFTLTSQLPKLTQVRGKKKYENPFFEKKSYDEEALSGSDYLTDDVYAKRRSIIGKATNKQLTFELRHQSGPLLETFISHLCETLGLVEPKDLPCTWQTPELTITLTTQHLGELGSELVLNPKTRKKGEQEKQAIQKRVSKVVSQVAQAGEMIGTFVELGGAKTFDKDKDPKKALRLGFAATGRPTQFIQLGGDDIANRVKSGFLDLLRQLGILPDMSSLPTEGLPKPLNYLGIWLINKQGKPVIPVMIHIAASDGQLLTTAPGLNGWVSYRDLLAAVAQNKVESYRYNERARVVSFIQEQLEGDVLALGNTLLLCHAQNLRSTWNWLQDGKITRDQIAFGGEPPQPISDPAWQGLRIIRVRSNRDHETPQWYAQDEDQQGFSQGLFQIGERVFASTYQKPVAMKKLSPSLSRIKTVISATDKVYEPAPNVYAWNPAIYELTVACLQPGDDPVAWATLAHMLRGISIHYNDPTALPLPLHLAKQVEEYA